MLDHVTIGVRDIDRSRQFYDQALHPSGINRLYAEGTIFSGSGIGEKAFFWSGARERPQTSVNFAFTCDDRATSMPSTPQKYRLEEMIVDHPACAHTIMQTIMALSFWTRTVTISKLFAFERLHRCGEVLS